MLAFVDGVDLKNGVEIPPKKSASMKSGSPERIFFINNEMKTPKNVS
mgnify:CR=1 FL=1